MMLRKFRRQLLHLWFRFRRPITLGVRILIRNENGEVLLVRHTYTPGWHFPGGGVEAGNTIRETAEIEVFEETGIEIVGQLRFFGVYFNRNASARDHVVMYICDDWQQVNVFHPNHEIAETGFFALSDLPDSITPGTLRRLEEVIEVRDPEEHW